MKKIAVIIYPSFSLVEITNLTYFIGAFEKIDFLASERRMYLSEDGFQVIPNYSFDEVCPSDYRCIILPGTNPIPVLYDKKTIDFLKGCKGKDLLIAAISSSPLLLAKAGLLSGKKYTAGIFQEMFELFDFLEKDNYIIRPVVEDGNIITALGMFYREFAQQVLDRLGYDYKDDFTICPRQSFEEKDYIWNLSEEGLKRIKQEIFDIENQNKH